ncbi:MAG: hypothetical protein C0599_06450 [Salinivirgaceae bacterium]|nr:MAG: hypothetical protein C0599_06450 [Salinivirgaceae bacterium]
MLPEYNYESKTRLGKETPAYTVVDAGFEIRDLFVKGLQFKFNCTNLGNINVFHPVTTLNQFADRGLLDFYRRFFIGFKYEF